MQLGFFSEKVCSKANVLFLLSSIQCRYASERFVNCHCVTCVYSVFAKTEYSISVLVCCIFGFCRTLKKNLSCPGREAGNSLMQTVHTHHVCVRQAVKLVAAL